MNKLLLYATIVFSSSVGTYERRPLSFHTGKGAVFSNAACVKWKREIQLWNSPTHKDYDSTVMANVYLKSEVDLVL